MSNFQRRRRFRRAANPSNAAGPGAGIAVTPKYKLSAVTHTSEPVLVAETTMLEIATPSEMKPTNDAALPAFPIWEEPSANVTLILLLMALKPESVPKIFPPTAMTPGAKVNVTSVFALKALKLPDYTNKPPLAVADQLIPPAFPVSGFA